MPVNNADETDPTSSDAMIPADTPGTRGSLALRVLIGLLFLEAAAMIVVVIVLVVDILTLPAASLASAIALTVLVAIAAVFISAVAIGALRRQSWVRGGAVIWQLVQLAIAIGAFQGSFAQPAIGWALLAPSVIVLILLFRPSVMAAIRRDAG
jgi:hypothetical protein